MTVIHVRLGERSYPIFIGRDILKNAGRFIKERGFPGAHVLIVSQKEIPSSCKDALIRSLSEEKLESSIFLPPHGRSSESSKSQDVYLKLIRKIAFCDGRKKALILIALGGGVVGDLTGFAAAAYRRGIPYVQIPTTLTAQVDSAIGGKTGIDLPEGKNLLGAVHQPLFVLSDSSLLNTLPSRAWSDGFAEIIKYGVIKDPGLFSALEKWGKEGIIHNPRILEKIISRSSQIKAKAVERDEFDKKGHRIILNFGHTVGHAIEAASRYSRQYTHGEGVAIGMLVACDIAEKLGILNQAELRTRLEKILVKFELPLFHKGVATNHILKAIGYDKKREGGSNRFVLPLGFGKMRVVKDVPIPIIVEAIEKRKG